MPISIQSFICLIFCNFSRISALPESCFNWNLKNYFKILIKFTAKLKSSEASSNFPFLKKILPRWILPEMKSGFSSTTWKRIIYFWIFSPKPCPNLAKHCSFFHWPKEQLLVDNIFDNHLDPIQLPDDNVGEHLGVDPSKEVPSPFREAVQFPFF